MLILNNYKLKDVKGEFINIFAGEGVLAKLDEISPFGIT